MKSSIAITFLAVLAVASMATALSVRTKENECVGENETLVQCGSMCPRTCLNRNLAFPCVLMCKVNACVCKPGFMRVGADAMGGNGRCIEEVECDATIEKMRRHD